MRFFLFLTTLVAAEKFSQNFGKKKKGETQKLGRQNYYKQI